MLPLGTLSLSLKLLSVLPLGTLSPSLKLLSVLPLSLSLKLLSVLPLGTLSLSLKLLLSFNRHTFHLVREALLLNVYSRTSS